jgi:hypothetical protein
MSRDTQSHPLSERHFRQVICRNKHLNSRMRSVWAVTWRPGDQTGHFLGKLFRPLGSAVMMVQVPYHRPGDRPGLGLFGVVAMVNPNDAHIAYEECRLRHEFHFVPRVDARGTVLNPAKNASWVQLALEVDHVRQRSTERNFMLPPVPTMPRVYVGFATAEAMVSKFVITPTLRQLAAEGLEIRWEGGALSDLQNFASENAAAREKVFNSWSADVQEVAARAAWDRAAILPQDPNNPTGLWLIPQELIMTAYGSTRVFEHFGGLVGAHVFNPARKLTGKKVPNPAIEVAKAAGVNLVEDLAKIENVAEDDTNHKDVEERLVGLLPEYRRVTEASVEINDQDLLHALCAYAEPVLVTPALENMSEKLQIVEMRSMLKPHISEACTDEDILMGVMNPHSPLYASGLATIQTLRRDVRIPLEDSMYFNPQALGRERMSAQFWYDLPQPRATKAKVKVEDHVHVETVAAPAA